MKLIALSCIAGSEKLLNNLEHRDDTVDYALKQNKIVIQINPETSEVSMLSKRFFESV